MPNIENSNNKKIKNDLVKHFPLLCPHLASGHCNSLAHITGVALALPKSERIPAL